MILFVGDSPASKNIDPNVPFVGTQSYKRLLEWIWRMDIDISNVEMVNQSGINFECLVSECSSYYNGRIIALGNNATNAIQEYGVKHRFKSNVFKLPHPSGRNHKLNDKKWLTKQLKLCKMWLTS